MSWILSVEWVRWPALDKADSDLREGEKLERVNGVWIWNSCTNCGDMAEWVWECDVCGGEECETGYLCLKCFKKKLSEYPGLTANSELDEANARLIAASPRLSGRPNNDRRKN